MKTIQGPSLHLAQFAADTAPFNTLPAIAAWAAGMGFIVFKVLDKIHGLRVPKRIEEEGLDIYEHGESAYN